MDLDPRAADVLKTARTIAVVGCSPKAYRDSNSVARYLVEQGFIVVPVNPKHDMILNVKSHSDLYSAREEEGQIDIVDIFRAPEHVVPHVREAIDIGARLVFMQLGVINDQAARLAMQAGIPIVMDRCLKIDHMEMKRRRLL